MSKPPHAPGIPPEVEVIQPDSPYLSDRGREIRDAVRELVPLLRREAQQAEQQAHLTQRVVEALDEAGVFLVAVPIEYGGYALGARDFAEINLELGRGDGSAGWLSFVAGGMRMVAAFPEQLTDELFELAGDWVGPLTAGGSTFAQTSGTARKVHGGWMVSGKWTFASGSRHAVWLLGGVEFADGDRPGRAFVALPREQVEIVDDWKVMGLSATSSNSFIVIDEVFVPEHRIVDLAALPLLMDAAAQRYDGLAFKAGMRGSMLTVAVTNVAIAVGMARGTLECFIEQARARKPFNLPYDTVADMASTQVTAGKARAMINLAEGAVLSNADEIDRRALDGVDFAAAEESERTMDLIYAARLCAEAIDSLQLALGSSTVALRNPIQRFARDTRVLTTHGALRMDPMAEINGRQILGLEPFPMFAGGLPLK